MSPQEQITVQVGADLKRLIKEVLQENESISDFVRYAIKIELQKRLDREIVFLK